MPEIETDPERMAAMMLGLKGAVVLDVREDSSGLWIDVELESRTTRCPVCGVAATLGGIVSEQREGLEVFGRPSVMTWRLRRWRCSDQSCAGEEWREEVPPDQRGRMVGSSDQSGRPA